jgi:hypothetical protein
LALDFLRAAEKAEVGEDILTDARKRLEAARAARDSAIPPEQVRSRLQQKLRSKENVLAKARESESRCKETLQQATAKLEEASEEVAQRLRELEALQAELTKIPEEDEFSCEGEDERLEQEFRGNVNVVRLHRQLEAEKAKARGAGGSADHQGDGDEPTAMEFTFDGADVSDDDLEALGAAGDGVNVEQRLERKHQLARIIEQQCRKKMRNAQGGGVRRTHGKS